MDSRLHQTELGPIVVDPEMYADERGHLQVAWSQHGVLPSPVAQVTVLHSRSGVTRGLHVNVRRPQWKLVMSLWGTHWSVAVDVRPTSDTRGKWVGVFLSPGAKQFLVPPGFAHGLVCLSERGVAQYLSNVGHDPEGERGLAVDSEDARVDWPLSGPEMIVAEKDRKTRTIAELWA